MKKTTEDSIEKCVEYFGADVAVCDSIFVAFAIDVASEFSLKSELSGFLRRLKVEMDRIGTINSDVDLMREMASNEYKRISYESSCDHIGSFSDG